MPTPKVLLVDDVEFFLEMGKDLLRQTPATIITARNGLEALAMARSESPNLIFMDLTMPVMDGLTCCRLLKADPLLRQIPVVMVFAPTRDTDVAAVQAAGCSAVLIKPIDRKAFLETGRRFLFHIDRRERRIPCTLPVTLQLQGREIGGVCVDLGEGGMFVECGEAVTKGGTVRVSLALPGAGTEKIECWAQVAWVNSPQSCSQSALSRGFGLEFRKLLPATKKSLCDFLARQGALYGR
jgi:CheY-like chemotaxis protein